MSRSGKQPVNGSRILVRILFGMLIILLASSAVAIYFKQEIQIKRIEERKKNLSQELQIAGDELAELQELKGMMGTAAYIERIARNELGMIRPDEVVFDEP